MTTETASLQPVTIGPMEASEGPIVLDLLVRALRDNPGNIGMFGPDPERRQRSARRIYAMLLADLARPPLVARSGGRIVGAAAVSPPETCFFRRSQARVHRLHIAGRDIYLEAPSVSWRQLAGLLLVGLPALGRAATAARSGAAHDPEAPHWHVELVGVEPELQGRGIGGRLVEAIVSQAEGSGEAVYLETDTAKNVAFYRRWCFEVVAQEEVLGAPAWYMERPAVRDCV